MTEFKCFGKFVVFIVLCILSVSVKQIQTYRVLGLFPAPYPSHMFFFHPIMREVANAGHNVTVVSYFPDKNAPANYKDIVLTALPTSNDGLPLSVSTQCR